MKDINSYRPNFDITSPIKKQPSSSNFLLDIFRTTYPIKSSGSTVMRNRNTTRTMQVTGIDFQLTRGIAGRTSDG